MELTNPIEDMVTIQQTLSIKPSSLSGQFYANLLSRAKEICLKKNIRNGHVMDIRGILEIVDSPIVCNENLSDSSMAVTVKMVTRMCLPKVGDIMYAKVIKMNEKLVQAKLGPIVIVINLFNVDKSTFKATIAPQKWLKVKALQVNYHIGDKRINVYGNLEDVCTEQEELNEVKEYLKELKL
jgi:DNA-directed RNA polymerase subunit E'/Rpb7